MTCNTKKTPGRGCCVQPASDKNNLSFFIRNTNFWQSNLGGAKSRPAVYSGELVIINKIIGDFPTPASKSASEEARSGFAKSVAINIRPGGVKLHSMCQW